MVGAGAFGRNHLRVLRELGEVVALTAVVDANLAAAQAASDRYSVPAFLTVAEMLDALTVDAACVCVPTMHHADVAVQLLHAGVDVLIEKPLAASLEDADRILAAVRGQVMQVGHLERFNPAVTGSRRFLNKPMFFESHRLSVFTPRSLDIDVVLDLMIHDLDLVLSMARSEVREVRAVGLAVLSPKVDIANVRLEFESGCVANFTASRVSTEQVRKLRFFQPRQYLSLDFARKDLLVIDVPESGRDMAAVAAAHPSPGLALRKVPVETGEPLRLEIESFLRAVRERAVPEVTGSDGRRALALALEINAAIADHARRAGLYS